MAQSLGIPVTVWEPIAMAESGLNPAADNPKDTNGGWSVGLFQTNQFGQGAGYQPSQLLDPITNASVALPYIATATKQGQAQGLSGYSLLQYVASHSGHLGILSNPNLSTYYTQAASGQLAPSAGGSSSVAPATTTTATSTSNVQGLEGALLSAAGNTTQSMSILQPATWFPAFGTIAAGVIVAGLIVWAGIKAWQ